MLTWPDVDPARHPFDPAEAHGVVRLVAPPVPPPARLEKDGYVGLTEARQWCAAMNDALVDHYGRWAGGWCWSMGVGGSEGGPVRTWCCAADSIGPPDETLARVADSLIEWRDWLERLAERFASFLPLTGDVVTGFEVAVAQLVNLTLGRTTSESGWHGHCWCVLGWFLAAAGVPESRHATLLEDAIGGRFRSWVTPSPADVIDVAERLARGVVEQPFPDGTDEWPDTWPDNWPSRRTTNLPTAAEPERDDVAVWRATRARIDWRSVTADHDEHGEKGERDAIAEHAARRGQALASALAEARAEAAEGGPLTFARLAAWQRTVLGVPEARFRTGTAFAKRGRERYSWRSDYPDLFEACLAEATDPEVPLPARAARVYLDVAFFHPFDDGNGRAAMLALDFVLARAGVVLDRAEPVLVTVRRADDAAGAVALARLVHGASSAQAYQSSGEATPGSTGAESYEK